MTNASTEARPAPPTLTRSTIHSASSPDCVNVYKLGDVRVRTSHRIYRAARIFFADGWKVSTFHAHEQAARKAMTRWDRAGSTLIVEILGPGEKREAI